MMKQARLVELRFAQAEMTERQNKLGAEGISSVLEKNGKWVIAVRNADRDRAFEVLGVQDAGLDSGVEVSDKPDSEDQSGE